MNEKELAERIIAEAQRWTENQFTLQDGVPGMTAQTRNEAKARDSSRLGRQPIISYPRLA